MESAEAMYSRSQNAPTRWWRRLSELLNFPERSDNQSIRLNLPPTRATGAPSCIGKDSSRDAITQSDNVVAFPFGGRNALWRLANELNASVTTNGMGNRGHADPILLAVTYGSFPRLIIDSTSHVETSEGHSLFRVVLGSDGDARVSLETCNYDKVKQFVWEYLQATRVPGPKVGTGR